MLRRIATLLLASLGLACTAVASEIRVLAPNAAKEAVSEAISVYEQATGHKVVVAWTGTEAITKLEVFTRLGVGEQLKAKTKQPHSGAQIADFLAAGEADLGFQQVSELLHAKGIRYLGPIPANLQNYTIYSAALHVRAANADAARALLGALRSLTVPAIVRTSGMEPI